MRRILPIVTSVLIFSLVIVACTSAADSGGNKAPATSTDATQVTPIPTESTSSLSTNSSDPAKPDEASSKEEDKNNSTSEANQKEKNAKPTNSTTESSTPSKTPATQEKSKPSSPAKPSSSSSNRALSSVENEVVRLVNIERQKAGLQPLVADTKLSSVARTKSQDMIDLRYFDHQSPRYGSPFDMMRQFGIRYQAAGENIACGHPTPAEVMKSWMNSPGHRANILSRDFTKIGVGSAKGGSYGVYWTQQFIR
ncbi:CAP domain-containing protein [Thermoactinomyces sp. DSM 45892]|uniref:CAP domain-containing protein n=1 Tax=Thermoactinomyces sp. DSM 45892 TaxID=1882753 RepID=UPI000896E320|nr:CAP domain-containing protein [Thermoactinomyces sp. DSM 45892]SDZ04553.1 uncharacterized protein, YkwD family [Thermoactinomyces sp. DSM 45892]